MPQSVVPSGGQVGTGIRRDCAEEDAIVRADADEVWVEAMAPVSARTTTKARTMIFMGNCSWGIWWVLLGSLKVVDRPTSINIE